MKAERSWTRPLAVVVAVLGAVVAVVAPRALHVTKSISDAESETILSLEARKEKRKWKNRQKRVKEERNTESTRHLTCWRLLVSRVQRGEGPRVSNVLALGTCLIRVVRALVPKLCADVTTHAREREE